MLASQLGSTVVPLVWDEETGVVLSFFGECQAGLA